MNNSPSGTTIQTVSRGPTGWTRRNWLARTAGGSAALLLGAPRPSIASGISQAATFDPVNVAGLDVAEHVDLAIPQMIAKNAVDAARAAGATYADARLTRTVTQLYGLQNGGLSEDTVFLGVGVRTLVNGYWGFAASPVWSIDEGARLARAAIAQARVNAKGSPRTVDMGRYPVATGTWTTPIDVDPFAVTIEEKNDTILYWMHCAERVGLSLDTLRSSLFFVRQERVVATTDGALIAQTLYETRGDLYVTSGPKLAKMDVAGKGWELLLDADIPQQLAELAYGHGKGGGAAAPAVVGRYTLVCDGLTMARVLERTLGTATQLDRALGYEANASGTSFLNEPLAMLGQLQIASPMVTIATNRSAAGQLATVKWDDEGVAPPQRTLITKGILSDYQTTREQAAWLAPYYQRSGRPIHSNGCAAAEDALTITMQHMPNLALEPSTSPVSMDDLIANVSDGILLTDGNVGSLDFQSRRGLLGGEMHRIKNGRLGAPLIGGAILFDTSELWKKITALGGAATEATAGFSQYPSGSGISKGQPAQASSHSTTAAAATITSQAIIDPNRRM